LTIRITPTATSPTMVIARLCAFSQSSNARSVRVVASGAIRYTTSGTQMVSTSTSTTRATPTASRPTESCEVPIACTAATRPADG
jgi:hypothetical protein